MLKLFFPISQTAFTLKQKNSMDIMVLVSIGLKR